MELYEWLAGRLRECDVCEWDARELCGRIGGNELLSEALYETSLLQDNRVGGNALGASHTCWPMADDWCRLGERRIAPASVCASSNEL